MNIKEQYEILLQKQAWVTARLEALRNTCLHPDAVKVYKSNCGYGYENYWKDCTCPDCGKFWTEPQ